MPIKRHNLSVWRYRNRRKLLLHQVVVIGQLPALHTLKIWRINAPGICRSLRRWAPLHSTDFDFAEPLDEAPFSGDFGRTDPLEIDFAVGSTKTEPFEDDAAENFGVADPFEEDAASPFGTALKRGFWPRNCHLRCLCRRTRCNRWPGWGWRWLCNTLGSWDQSSDFWSWLRHRPWRVSQRILSILSLINFVVTWLRLQSAGENNGRCCPPAWATGISSHCLSCERFQLTHANRLRRAGAPPRIPRRRGGVRDWSLTPSGVLTGAPNPNKRFPPKD